MKHSIFVRNGRRVLLLMQVFSTLGLSVLYSSLVLYATQKLELDSQYALAITGSFIAFNFSLHVLGGYVGGRLLSYRGLFIIGMVLQAIGCLIMAKPDFHTLIWGSALFLSGCGLNVICINCMLTQLFDPHDKQRESAFLWNYSGMNLGFFIGFTVSGFFQLHKAFSSLFIFASVGSVIAILIALCNWKYLKDRQTDYSQCKNPAPRASFAGLIILGLILALALLLKHANLSNELICAAGIVVALLFVYLAWSEKKKEKSQRIWAYLILSFSSLIFWTLYQMAPMGLTLFYERNMHHFLFGYLIPPQWMQNINTIVIVLGGPFLATINQRLRKKGYKISLPFQFTTALFLIGAGFLLLPIGIHYADPEGYSSIIWVIGAYFFQSIGELFISPIGWAMIGQLIPPKIQALAMGAWLMVTGVAATLSNYFSQSALGHADSKDPLITNPSYSAAFLKLALCSILGSLILLLLRPFLHKLIQDKGSLKSIEPAPYNAPQD